MAALIRQRRVATDSWQRLDAGATPADVPGAGPVIVPLALWHERRDALVERGGIGVWLEPSDDPATLADDLAALPLVEVRFPKFGDGRGYSIGRLLRSRYAFAGELRATGDVGRDALLGLERCGFDAFVLREGEDPERALAAFGELTEAYQGTATEPRPLFRRRLATGG
jgi:uncharacterized protein (DUF934 family)